MASNPVFRRIDNEIDQQYAGFRSQPGAGQTNASASGQVPPTAGYPGIGYQDHVSSEQLQDMYQRPSAGPVQTGRLTVDDVIMKTLGLFTLLVVVAAGSWMLTANQPSLAMPLWIAGMLLGLVVGIAIAFRKTVSVPLIVGYAVLEGVFVGAMSQVFEQMYPGLVATAVIATVATFAGMFGAYKVGLIKVTSKSRRIFGMALWGYLLFSLVNVVALLVGWTEGWGFGGSGMMGLLISSLGVGLASYSLAIDFDSIDHAVRAQVPERYSWLLAHGLIVSLVWLYIEILRLLARLRD